MSSVFKISIEFSNETKPGVSTDFFVSDKFPIEFEAAKVRKIASIQTQKNEMKHIDQRVIQENEDILHLLFLRANHESSKYTWKISVRQEENYY